MVRLLVFLNLGIVTAAAAQAPAAVPLGPGNQAGTPSGAPQAELTAAQVIAEIDALHLHRDNPVRVAKLEALLQRAVAAHPNDYELIWRASRFQFWKADGQPPSHPERIRAGKAGWELGERAVALRPTGPEGHYYAAVSIGAYALGIGILKAMGEGLETKFHKHLDASIKASLEYERRGALVARARAYYEVPWPKRDLEKAETILTQVVAKHPMNLRAWLYLAETQLRRKQPRQALESINKVFEGSTEYDPPEARRAKGWAQWAKAQIDKELK